MNETDRSTEGDTYRDTERYKVRGRQVYRQIDRKRYTVRDRQIHR